MRKKGIFAFAVYILFTIMFLAFLLIDLVILVPEAGFSLSSRPYLTLLIITLIPLIFKSLQLITGMRLFAILCAVMDLLTLAFIEEFFVAALGINILLFAPFIIVIYAFVFFAFLSNLLTIFSRG